MKDHQAKGPAQPTQIDQAANRKQDAGKSQTSAAKPTSKPEDMPGADGPLSARADEDTYD